MSNFVTQFNIFGSVDKLLNEIRSVGTDSASWFLFHPDDLSHRSEAPINWWAYDFALQKEFAAGNLIAVDTGSDGGFTVRFTDQSLTEREQSYVVNSQAFRLRVRRDHLFVDGGYVLPSKLASSLADFPNQWIEVPNGDYQVTVYALAWYEESGAVDTEGSATENALPAYVAVFKAVEDIEAVDPPPSIPVLDPSRPEISFRPDAQSYLSSEIHLEQEYALLVRPEVIFPDIDLKLNLTQSEYEYLDKAMRHDFGFSLIIANSLKPQATATWFKVSSFGSSSYRSSFKEAHMSGRGLRRVRLTNVYKRDGIHWAEVEPFEPLSDPAAPALVEKLKHWFAQYAATDIGYQERIEYHRFYAERVDSLTNPLSIGWAIAQAVDLPLETKRNLLIASEADLIWQLNEIVRVE